MSELDVTGLTFTIPARILRPSEQRQIDLLTTIKERHVLDATILDEKTPFFWDAEISSDLVDAYSSHMMVNTLSNFRDDAISGVSYLPGHNHHELPLGRSFDASLESSSAPPLRTRVIASFYTLPGLRFGGVATDDLIDGLRGGILKDVSVGFFGGESLCDLCNRSIWDWDCVHVPGLRYEVKEGNLISAKLATYAVHNARLSEVSSVFDGATPRAEVIKAEREAAEGRMKPDAVRMIEERYRVKLPTRRQFAVSQQKDKTMDFEQVINQIREARGLDASADIVTALQTEGAELSRLRALEPKLADASAKLIELEPLAADGRAYRADLVAAALEEGVRAHGDKFDQATYETVLRNSPIAIIKRMRDDWMATGDQRLSGGRQSTDEGEPAGKPKQRTTVPQKAYAV